MHRRRSPKQRLRPILIALVVLSVIGLAVVLFDHYGQGGTGSNALWSNPIGYTVGAPPVGASPAGPLSVAAQSAGPHSAAPALAAPPVGTSSRPTQTDVVTSLDVPFPRSGPRTFGYARFTGPVLGTAGPIKRFRVAIESNIKAVVLADFQAAVLATLGDARSWVAGGDYRLQMVPKSAPSQFTIYLATSATSTKMCAPLPTNGYTSCRQGTHVVLNLDRWMTSVPDYIHGKIALNTYRTYMINHEVGHALGHSHERCPATGKPAPVMQQQTLGLRGCIANPWPYVNGKAYDGPLGSY